MLELSDALGAMDVKVGDRLLTLRGVTGTQRDNWEARMLRFVTDDEGNTHPVVDKKDVKAALIQPSLFDGDQLAYPTIEACGALPTAAVDALYDAVRELSGMADDSEEVLGND